MHFTTQLPPLLQLARIGSIAIQCSKGDLLAFQPPLVLQLVTPLALGCESVEIALDASIRVIDKRRELGKPVDELLRGRGGIGVRGHGVSGVMLFRSVS